MNTLALSFRRTLGSMRLIGLIYGITLVLGLLVAFPFYSTLGTESDRSLAFMNLLNGFDYTVFADFMQSSQKAISPLMSVGRWVGVLYLFLSVFFSGGILLCFSHSDVSPGLNQFWQGCAQYVGRFARLFGVVLLFLVISTTIWLVTGLLVGAGFSDMLTEEGLLWISMVFFVLFALSSTLLLCIGDYGKVIMVRDEETKAFRAFGRAGRLVLASLLRTYGPYCLLILIGTGLFGLYFLLDDVISMSNWVTIGLMFLIQQSLIFARVGLKVWSLGVASTVYETLPRPVLPVSTATSPIGDPIDEAGDHLPLSSVQ